MVEEGLLASRAELARLLAGEKVQRNELVLRKACLDDCEEIAGFHLRLWRQTYGDIAPQAAIDALGFERRKEQWAGKLSGNRRHALTLLAEDAHGQIVGFCDLALSGFDGFADAIELTHLYLDEAVRGQGLGRHLLNLARLWAQECDEDDLVLAVVRQNTDGLAFYHATGGTPVAEQIDSGPLWRSENVIMRWPSST